MKRLCFSHVVILALAASMPFVASVNAQSAGAKGPQAATANPGGVPAKPARIQADAPSPKMDKDGKPQQGFLSAHESFLKRGKEGKVGLVFLGDSITAGWNGQKQLVSDEFGKYDLANFGIGGDRTEHVLWRIANGELDGLNPKALVFLLGTNNLGGYSAEEIVRGDKKIIEEIRKKLPNTRIILMAIFPRGDDPKKPPIAKTREKINAINAELAKLNDGKMITFLDIGSKLTEPDGSITKEIMPDALHLSAKGYQVWAAALRPVLAPMFGGTVPAADSGSQKAAKTATPAK